MDEQWVVDRVVDPTEVVHTQCWSDTEREIAEREAERGREKERERERERDVHKKLSFFCPSLLSLLSHLN